jgi:hypothetical protein
MELQHHYCTSFYRQVIPTGLTAEMLVPRSIKVCMTEYWRCILILISCSVESKPS